MQILREQQHIEEYIEPSGTWPTGTSGETARILVADDDPQVLRVVVRILRGAGFDVESVSTSGEALALIERLPFDAVVTDLFVPAMSGTDILAAVRKHAPLVPVVIISGRSDPGCAWDLPADVALHFLAKPFCARDLADLLRELTGRATAQR